MAATVLLVLVVVLVAGGLVFGVVSLITGDDPGLGPVDPDRRARPLPNNRSLTEHDLKAVQFDLALRGYRMAQVDRVLRRTAYNVGYKDEMIAVLEAEVAALREGRREDAELLRKARESANSPVAATASEPAEAPAGTVIPPEPAPTADEPVQVDLALPDDGVDDESDDADDPASYTGPGRLARRPLLDQVELTLEPPAGELDDEPPAVADEMAVNAGGTAVNDDEAEHEALVQDQEADHGTPSHG